jgi:hypothetical protein
MVGVWTIEVGGSSRKYKKIDFERKLDNKTPSKFTATVEFNSGIDYWDLVEIKRDGTTEWKGFVEDKDEAWDSNNHLLNIGGRDTTVILWKKWSESFVDMHEATKGFFGNVSVTELIKLLLRCPKSDLGEEFPYNKEGWGIDKSKIAACRASRTSSGDPNWVRLRKRGYGWRNTGNPYNSVDADVDALISNNWSTAGSSPYIDAEDATSYIYSKTAGQTGIFSFENLSTLDANATSVEKCFLNILWRPDASWWFADRARVKAYVSPDNGSTWYFAGYFDGKGSVFGPIVWQTYSFDVSSVINTVAKADAARVKLEVSTGATLYAYIDHVYLTFSYTTDGEQTIDDEFDVVLAGAETLVGLYMESRMDEESYPINYGVLKIVDNQQNYTGYTETDPNTHISKAATQIDFDAYMNEDAYVYKDFGADYFTTYFDHIFEVTVQTDPITASACLGIWAVANDVDDYVGLAGGVRNNLGMAIKDDGGVAPYFELREINGGAATTDTSSEITEGTTYTIWIKRRAGNVKAYIYTGGLDGTLFDTLDVDMAGASNTFRYLYGCLTYNDGTGVTHTDVDLNNLLTETYTDLGYKNNNTFKDVIHSWTPESMSHLRIRITIDDADHAWAISQLYLYKADDVDYRVWKETGSPSFATNQYIQAFSEDDSYTTPIGPLNVPKARLLDAIASIIQQAHDSYTPYAFWLAMDSNNTFHIATERGTDVSGSVSFQKGQHIGEVSKNGSVSDTAQRVKVVGKSEGQRQDKVNSDWAEDTAEMSSINTFYEDVLTEKTIASKEVADLLANIALDESAPAREPKKIPITRDVYASMAYDVGDLVTVTDSITSLSGAHRIYNIQKRIDNNGEYVVLTIDAKRRIPEDAIKDIYRRLKELGLTGVLTSDWVGEADQANKVDSKLVTESFSKTAKNGEGSDEDITDPSWYVNPSPTGYTPYGNHFAGTSVQYYSFANGKYWKHKSEWMGLWGPNSGSGADSFVIERRGETYIDQLDVRMDQNPKFEAEIRAIRDTTGNINGGNACNWNVGDYVELGMYDSANSYGFFFRLIKEADGNILKVYAVWNTDGTNEYSELVREIEISDHENDDIRYKLEILTELQDDNSKYIIFNVYDLNVEGQKYPPSSIVANVDNTMVIHPFYGKLSADRNADNSKYCILYIYNYKVEWEKLNPYYSET